MSKPTEIPGKIVLTPQNIEDLKRAFERITAEGGFGVVTLRVMYNKVEYIEVGISWSQRPEKVGAG